MFIVSLPHYLKFILWPDQRALSSSENPPSLFPAAFSVFSCKRTESSGGDVLIRRILGKAEGENADNNSGIVGYYFGSLAQTESSCCPAAEPSLLSSLPLLKVVSNGGVGIDHLNVPYINSLGVKVTNTPSVVSDATADIAMGLLLASARKIVEGEIG